MLYLFRGVLLGALLSSALTISAQTVIERDDFGAAGTIIPVTYDTNSVVVSPGPAGTGQAWDFSSLGKSFFTQLQLSDPSTLPESRSFPGANWAVQFPTYNVYYQLDNAGSTELGRAGTFEGDFTATAILDWSPNIPKLTFPAAVGQTSTHSAEFRVKGTGPFFGERAIVDTIDDKRTSTIVLSVDGQGSLNLGDTTYTNVLRVKEVETRVDSIRIFILGSWYDWNRPFTLVDGVKHVVYDTVVTYTFWAQNNAFPVLEMVLDAQDTVDHILYRNLNSLTSVEQAAAPAIASLPYPNPASGSLTIAFGSALPMAAELLVFDIQGRLVSRSALSPGDRQTVLSLQSWSSGLYNYQIVDANLARLSFGKIWVNQ